MNIYNAIMKAADHIEANPKDFSFGSVEIPTGKGCGSPGCALGWIAHFLGMRESDEHFFGWNVLRANKHLGFAENTDHVDHPFYHRLEELAGGWRYSAGRCAQALRLYAKKYHAPQLPDSVTAIFKQSPVEVKRQLEVMESQP